MIFVLLISLTACGVENINSNKISIGGKTYTVPFKGSELLDNGWKTRENTDAQNPNTSVEYSLKDENGNEITVAADNKSTEIMELKDCWIIEIKFYRTKIKEDNLLSLPGGLSMNSTYDNVIAAYGEASDSNPNFDNAEEKEIGSYRRLWYKCQKTSKISYEFKSEEKTPADYIRLNFYYAYLAATEEGNKK